MQITIHTRNNVPVAFLEDQNIVINNLDDAIDVLGNADYQGARKIILRKDQINEDFFNLRTGFAGEVLQKFSNYRMRLAIVGDFSVYTSKSLRDFIYESNKNRQIMFLSTTEEALQTFCG